MIIRNLLRRGTRSLLTVLGIAIGVAAVVSLGTIAQGIVTNYSASIGLSNDLLVTQANAYDVVFSSLDETLGERMRSLPGVKNVEPGVFGWITVGDTPYFLVYGYEPTSIAIRHYRIVEGKALTGGRQIVLGKRGAEALNKRLGDDLRIQGVPYQIVGIYETGQGMEESGGVVTLEDGQLIAQKQRQVSLFQVGLTPNANIEQVIERIQLLDDQLTVTKSSEFAVGEQWTAYLQGFAWGIAAIAILVGGLGMMSAMVMSVMERTREIGTLRAVGWSRRRVIQMILGEAVLLSLTGGLLGVLLGMALAWAAGQLPGVGALLEGTLSFAIFAQGMITALTLGIVGGIYPAWTAANLQPVEALRYEGGSTADNQGWLMRVGDQSFRNLWRRRTRTLISAAGISIGVATLVMLGGLIDGMIGQLNGLAGSGGTGSITIMQRDVADMSLSSLDERMVRAIQAMPEVKAASAFVLGVISSKEMPIFIIAGIDPSSPALGHYKLVAGRYIQRPNEIVLGKVAAETYKVGIGDTLNVYDNRYKIVGITETGIAYEDGAAMLALREAQRLMARPRTVSFIFVDVYDPRQVQAVADAIDRRFPEARASLSSEFAQSANDLQTTMALTNAIRVLAILVGGIVVANTMIMSIFERTREIGTLRALGWRPRRILGQILQESLYLCAFAAIVGSLLGVMIVMAAVQIPAVSRVLAPAWSVETFALAITVALTLGLFGGLYPAWRASRLQPVEALRYE